MQRAVRDPETKRKIIIELCTECTLNYDRAIANAAIAFLPNLSDRIEVKK